MFPVIKKLWKTESDFITRTLPRPKRKIYFIIKIKEYNITRLDYSRVEVAAEKRDVIVILKIFLHIAGTK